MSLPTRIEGYAIVSEDGMLADRNGVMPASLKFEADQRFFETGLDGVDAVAHGRHSHERQPHSPQRYRLILTRQIPSLAPDRAKEKALLWNPRGASIEEAWSAFHLVEGSLGVIGGTSVFGLFLDHYDVFHLTRAPGVRLPGGRPVFPGVPRQSPEDSLAAHGLDQAQPKSSSTCASDHGPQGFGASYKWRNVCRHGSTPSRSP